jgi:hypothetical protein
VLAPYFDDANASFFFLLLLYNSTLIFRPFIVDLFNFGISASASHLIVTDPWLLPFIDTTDTDMMESSFMSLTLCNMCFLMSSLLVFTGRFPMKSFTFDVSCGEQGHKYSDTDSEAQSESVSQREFSYTRQVL